MITGFLLIVGIYGICAALIHMFYARQRKAGKVRRYHLVLVTRNNQAEIEWYLYAYLFVSWLRGRETTVTVFDDGSTDDTWTILRRIAERNPQVKLHSSTAGMETFLRDHSDEALLVLHLERRELNPKMPLPRWETA